MESAEHNIINKNIEVKSLSKINLSKPLGFRCAKEAEIMLETISFWQDIAISIFKLSPFLSIKSYQVFKIY